MIDRYLLRYFLAVVDKGSFSRAAQHCGVSQPTLSVGIAKLEALLGCRVLERTNRRVALTRAGSRFAMHARRIESEFAEALRSVTEPAPRGVLRLGVLSSLPAAWLGPALGRFRAAGADIEIMEGRRAELGPLLDRKRADAILTTHAGADGAAAVMTEPYLLALPVGHRLAGAGEVDVRALGDEAMLVRRHCEALPEISAFFTGHGVRPRIAARTISDERARAFVAGGLGVTVMPACFANEGIAMAPLTGFDRFRTIGFQVPYDNRWMLDADGPIARLATLLRGEPAAVTEPGPRRRDRPGEPACPHGPDPD